MDMDDIAPPPRKSEALVALAAEDLDRLSAAEIALRIAALEAELARAKARAGAAADMRAAAENLFKR